MLLISEVAASVQLQEIGALTALSAEVTRSLAAGDESRAVRLLSSKIALRCLTIEKCKCASENVCLKCKLYIDEGDLIVLLNFIAQKLLALRLKLHARRPLQMKAVEIKIGESLVSMYRTLIGYTFGGVRVDMDLGFFVDYLLAGVRGVSLDLTVDASEFFFDKEYSEALKEFVAVARSRQHYSSRRAVVDILSAGYKLTNVSDRKLSNNGECPLYPQEILYRLLIAHDRQRGDVFSDTKANLRLHH